MSSRTVASRHSPAPPAPTRSVLIVEDEQGPRMALCTILTPFFKVFTAENAAAALAMIKEHRIDLVTLDLMLPDRNGIDLLKDLRQEQPHLDVIIITGHGTLESALAAKGYGASSYLLKPFNVADLYDVLMLPLEKVG